MSKVAAASTIPVMNAVRQENNSKSFRILVTIAAPLMRRPLKHCPHSALQYLGQKVMADCLN
jgi:hypothetical protein